MAMTLRLDPELDARLTALASEQRLSKQQVVVRAVERFMRDESHAARTRANSRRVIRENAELLDDLAQT